VQGAKLPIADSADFVIIIMGHAKMSSLRHAAANTYVDVNCGGTAVIARAVQAATNPTEGQRMLQAGFHGTILGGESREKTSTTTNADGIVRVDRVVERSAISEDGQMIVVQQVQQTAMPDNEMASKAELPAVKSNFVTKIHFDTNMSTISALIGDSMKGIVEIVKTTNENIAAVQTLVVKTRDETDKKIKCMKKKMQAKNEENDAKDAERDAKDEERDAKDAERDAKDEERDAKDAERDAKDEERDAKDEERDKLIATLQRASCNEKKRPAEDQGEGTSQKKMKSEPRFISKTGANSFMWRRCIDGVKHEKRNFKTVEAASKSMALYF